MADDLQMPSWLSPNLASAIEVTPVPLAPFWRVQIEYSWVEPGDSGTGSVALPAFGTLEAGLASLARVQANPVEVLASPWSSARGRVYTPTHWQLLRFEQWAFVFAEEVANGAAPA